MSATPLVGALSWASETDSGIFRRVAFLSLSFLLSLLVVKISIIAFNYKKPIASFYKPFSIALLVYLIYRDFLPLILEVSKTIDNPKSSWYVVVYHALISLLINAPLAFLEEFVYRVMPDQLIIRCSEKLRTSIIRRSLLFVGVAILFALSHNGGIYTILGFFITSILYSVLYDQVKSYLMIALMHLIHNSLIDLINMRVG